RDGRDGDPEARPEGLPLGRPPRELADVRERPVRRAERLGQRQHERVADDPEEHEADEDRGDAPAAHAPLRNPGGNGPPGDGAIRTVSPSRVAVGGARTSTSPGAVATT